MNTAVHIAPQVNNFVELFTGTALTLYTYAMTADGKLYSWGRNKTGDLGNGVSAINSKQDGNYPNSWDVTVPTLVTPLTVPDQQTSSPFCIQNPTSNTCWCPMGPPPNPQDC